MIAWPFIDLRRTGSSLLGQLFYADTPTRPFIVVAFALRVLV